MIDHEELRRTFARQGAVAHLGIQLVSIGEAEIVLDLPFRPELSQHHGFFHGGIVSTLLDTACGYAALSVAPPGTSVLSVEFKINFLAPARGALMRGVGRVVRAGRTISVSQGEASVDGVPCATMLATMILRHG